MQTPKRANNPRIGNGGLKKVQQKATPKSKAGVEIGGLLFWLPKYRENAGNEFHLLEIRLSPARHLGLAERCSTPTGHRRPSSGFSPMAAVRMRQPAGGRHPFGQKRTIPDLRVESLLLFQGKRFSNGLIIRNA